METLLNFSAVKSAMDNPPKSNKLNLFFDKSESQSLDEDQIENLICILSDHHKDIIDFLNQAKSKL